MYFDVIHQVINYFYHKIDITDYIHKTYQSYKIMSIIYLMLCISISIESTVLNMLLFWTALYDVPCTCSCFLFDILGLLLSFCFLVSTFVDLKYDSVSIALEEPKAREYIYSIVFVGTWQFGYGPNQIIIFMLCET